VWRPGQTTRRGGGEEAGSEFICGWAEDPGDPGLPQKITHDANTMKVCVNAARKGRERK
jgi:hypothetical protein